MWSLMVIMAIFKPNQSHLVDISIFCLWKGINNNNDNKKKKHERKMWLVGKRKTHLGKYFNCLLRFGAHHKRSICAPQSSVKGETQMVLRTKQWKPIHELGKIKDLFFLTIYLLCLCLGLYECIDLVMCGCSCFYTWQDCVCVFLMVQIDLQHWSCTNSAPKSPERTEFLGQPIKCAMNTSVCLSLQGLDISMSLRLSFYESPRLVVWSLDTQHTGQKEVRVTLS